MQRRAFFSIGFPLMTSELPTLSMTTSELQSALVTLRHNQPLRYASIEEMLADNELVAGQHCSTPDGQFMIVNNAGTIPNGATVIDLGHSSLVAVLFPEETLASPETLLADTRSYAYLDVGQRLGTRSGMVYEVTDAADTAAGIVTDGGVRLRDLNQPHVRSAAPYLDVTSSLRDGLDVSILRGIHPRRHADILSRSANEDLGPELSQFLGNVNSDHASASIFAPGGLYKADNLDLGSIVLKGSMEKRTTFSPFSSNADYVFKVSTARGAVQNLLLEHDRSFACDAILLEFASGPGTAASTNRWGEFRDLRMDGFLGAGLRGKNCIIESAFQNIYTYRCGDPGAGVASFDLDQPDVNNDHINNLLLRKIWAIFPYWKGIRLQSQKEDATSGASGIRVLTLDDVFVHGHTTAIETEPAPYDMLEIKNFTTLFARNWNFARVPNGKWAAVLDGIRTSEGYGINQTGRRGYLYGMNGSGVGGAQTAGGLNLKNVSDFSYDMLSMDGNFQNGTDVSMDANCARIMRGWIQNAGGRAPVISDASTGSRGWNGSGEYNFGGSRLRGVSGINNARNLAGRISVDDPDISGAVVFSNAEPDTSYRVILTTNRPGVVASYTALGTEGFTVNIIRNGDTASVNVDWVIIR